MYVLCIDQIVQGRAEVELEIGFDMFPAVQELVVIEYNLAITIQ